MLEVRQPMTLAEPTFTQRACNATITGGMVRIVI